MNNMPLFTLLESEEVQLKTKVSEYCCDTRTLLNDQVSSTKQTASDNYLIEASKHNKRELSLILRTLHAESRDEFKDSIRPLMTQEVWDIIQETEQKGLLTQSMNIFEHMTKQLLPQRFAEIVGWRTPLGLAQVIEPAENLKSDLRVVTLRLSSRGLKGLVAFRVIRDLTRVAKSFPEQARVALTEAIKQNYFTQIVYLEPLYHKDRLLRSQKSVKRYKCRPIDPLLVGFLGTGPHSYGYKLYDPYVRIQLKEYYRENQLEHTAFLIAHWD